MREDISRTLPHKRDARKEGAGYGMQQTLREAFTLFNAKNRDTKIGYTRFTPLRPKIIRKISTTFFFFLNHACVYWLSVRMKLLALNKIIFQNNLDPNFKV